MNKNKIFIILMLIFISFTSLGLAFSHPGHEGEHDPEEITTSDVEFQEDSQDNSLSGSSNTKSDSQDINSDSSNKHNSKHSKNSNSLHNTKSSSNSQKSNNDNVYFLQQNINDDLGDKNSTNETNATNKTNFNNFTEDIPKNDNGLFSKMNIIILFVIICVLIIVAYKFMK